MASGRYDEPPFSNGTDYEVFQAQGCNHCVFRSVEFGGPCDEFAEVAVLDDRTPLFLEPDGLTWRCTRYQYGEPSDG